MNDGLYLEAVPPLSFLSVFLTATTATTATDAGFGGLFWVGLK